MATMTECPNHAGAYDCSPFCAVCEGAQEVPIMITRTPPNNKAKREKMLKKSDLTIDRNSEGAWRVSAVVDGYLETRRYYGYTKEEALRNYLREFNKEESNA